MFPGRDVDQQGRLVNIPETLIFARRTSNGRVEWNAADGRTLKELQTTDTGSEG